MWSLGIVMPLPGLSFSFCMHVPDSLQIVAFRAQVPCKFQPLSSPPVLLWSLFSTVGSLGSLPVLQPECCLLLGPYGLYILCPHSWGSQCTLTFAHCLKIIYLYAIFQRVFRQISKSSCCQSVLVGIQKLLPEDA